MTMFMVNIADAKAKLSEYLDAVAKGERVVICNRNRPVAELRALSAAPVARRLGTAAGEVVVAGSFNDPLPADLLDAFEGRGPHGPGASKAVESKGSYAAKRARRG